MGKNQFGKQGWTPSRLGDLEDKTFLITGANSGIGFEATKILLSRGAEVIMLNRNEQKSNNAISTLKNEFGKNAKVTFIKMDLAELSSIERTAEKIIKTVPKIDVLICNAGVGHFATQKITSHGFEYQLGINHYGHFLLINLLFDKIEQTGKRIVIVGSNAYKMGLKRIQFEDMNFDNNYNQINSYCHSKLAQMVFAYEFQDRIKEAKKETKVYVCHPGTSSTSIVQKEANFISKAVMSILSFTPLIQSAEKGAYPQVMCATENNLKQRAYYGPTQLMDSVGLVGECALNPLVLNKEMATKLWTLSENQTGHRFHL